MSDTETTPASEIRERFQEMQQQLLIVADDIDEGVSLLVNDAHDLRHMLRKLFSVQQKLLLKDEA